MRKNMEYKEPEFKVVLTNAHDVLTASESAAGLNVVGIGWGTSSSGEGAGGMDFNL